MKRSRFWLLIMLLIVALALAVFCGVARGYNGSSVHYSPYALSYYSSGLVANNMSYSPYALSYYGSGLVPDYSNCYSSGFIAGPWLNRPSIRPPASKPLPKAQKPQPLLKVQKPPVPSQPKSPVSRK